MRTIISLSFILLLIVCSCVLFKPTIIYREYDKVPFSKNQNTCNVLKDSVLIYAIFVDTDIYHPWTEFDINTTMDSLEKATKWLQQKAADFSKPLHFECINYHNGGKLTIYEKTAKVSLGINGLFIKTKKKTKQLISWSDGISRIAGKGLKYTPSTKISKRLRIMNVQTLNQALRDKFQRENVSILFFVNGYYENHPSYTFNSESNRFAEYSIITNKNPAMISHEILHLFGAVDLYPNNTYPNFNFKELEENYPNEIMRIQHKEISKLMISPISAYFVGWQDSLDKPNTRLLLHKTDLIAY
ncbi:MAG: hypothetical protein K0S23_1844 [Fluviicola sp.]|jgi:hypothetical protein|uniref:hypothetical protein n=1 Tax=Fluviicola sp. TaxID=1917219 RepID=UPI0026081B9F|nr:hypothetical protein [Fluviicola sp.]MDF3027537.1 hypothetical protein [Fluviicola sp.]